MITFDEKAHLYFNDGFIVPSVTEILGAVYGTELEDAPAHFVERAAKKGTKIHKEIQKFITESDYKAVNAPETVRFVEYAQKHLKLDTAISEHILWAKTPYGEVCGTADLICEDNYENGLLADYKTSKTATAAQRKKWQMQLSIYKFMARQMGCPIDINRLVVLHLTEFECEEIYLDYLGDDFVLETMKLYSEGKKAAQESTQLQTVSTEQLATFAAVLQQIKALENKIEPTREAIKAEMESRGILNVQIGDVSVSYVAPTTRKTFDSTRFKADHADLFAAYQKESAVKSSIRIKVN